MTNKQEQSDDDNKISTELILEYVKDLDNIVKHFLNNPLIKQDLAYIILKSFAAHIMCQYAEFKDPVLNQIELENYSLMLMHPSSSDLLSNLSSVKSELVHMKDENRDRILTLIVDEIKKIQREKL